MSILFPRFCKEKLFYHIMSTVNSVNNLSFSINLPKTTVHSEEVMTAVNEILTKFYSDTQFQDYFYFHNFHKYEAEENEFFPLQQSDNTILCEINAGLWNKAFTSAINSLTQQTIPDFVVIQQFINYLLNSHSCACFGLLEEFFCKLLLSHSPKPQNFDYYLKILNEHFVTLNGTKSEEKGLFFCLIEILINCLKSKELFNEKFVLMRESEITTFLDSIISQDLAFNSKRIYFINESEYLLSNEENNFYRNEEVLEVRHDVILNKFSLSQTNKKNISYFEGLLWRDKIKRCLSALNFMYNILETDFAFWLNSKGLKLPSFKKNCRPLMSHLLWPEIREAGFINKEVHQILTLYKLVQESENCGFPQVSVINKLVNLLAEVIRCSDSLEEIKYPFLGTKTNNLARELSVGLHQNLIELCHKNELAKADDLILFFKPPWFRLLLSAHLLSYLTGYQCLPELTGAYDILEHIAHAEFKGKKDDETKRIKKFSVNSEIVRRFKKLKSVNAKLSNGKTRLQVACEVNNVEEVKALLTFPELDVNASDFQGWTALHIASFKGNTSSVQQLLQFCPKSGDLQKPVNTRARGPESITPLMCAVTEGHTEVCRLLLEHAGSVLLEDINESNQSALELSNKKEVTRILKHYKDNIVWTLHSRKDIHFDEKNKEIVLKLCVEMVQSYFCTHRTWDVYRYLKKRNKNFSQTNSLHNSEMEFEWDYVRYHRDIKRNIYKLRRLIPKLSKVREFKSLYEIFTGILSLNKSC